jgi:hypothetical protein
MPSQLLAARKRNIEGTIRSGMIVEMMILPTLCKSKRYLECFSVLIPAFKSRAEYL